MSHTQLIKDTLNILDLNIYFEENCLTRDISGLPETYTTTLRTFKKFLPQIQNALHYSYSNGPLECLNNHIKVLKRNAYGFRNFYNFKLRIMIRHGKTFLTK